MQIANEQNPDNLNRFNLNASAVNREYPYLTNSNLEDLKLELQNLVNAYGNYIDINNRNIQNLKNAIVAGGRTADGELEKVVRDFDKLGKSIGQVVRPLVNPSPDIQS